MFEHRFLIVGGTFDDNGGRESGLIREIRDQICKYFINVKTYNGGSYEEMEGLLSACTEYDIIFWAPNVPNEKPKIRNVKDINQKVILITSKRNDNNKYAFNELVSKALEQKANLCIEFTKKDSGKYNMRVFDPLGNLWYDGDEICKCAIVIAERSVYLSKITRQSCKRATSNVFPSIPNEKDFFDIIKKYAEVFHELINPANDIKRFLGNSSFRCTKGGFPSFKRNDYVYVSMRNVDKRYVDRSTFVPVKLINNEVYYWGDSKPSVDTPTQLRLYEKLPNINYMIHSHVYLAFAPFTSKMIPCGGLEEVDEILDVIKKNYGSFNRDFYIINLKGHGSIMMAKRVEQLKEAHFVKRDLPEKFYCKQT